MVPFLSGAESVFSKWQEHGLARIGAGAPTTMALNLWADLLVAKLPLPATAAEKAPYRHLNAGVKSGVSFISIPELDPSANPARFNPPSRPSIYAVIHSG